MNIIVRRMFAAIFALCMLGAGTALAQRTDLGTFPGTNTFENLTAWGGVFTNVNITNGWYSSAGDESTITNLPYDYSACSRPVTTGTHTNVLRLATQGTTLSNSLGAVDVSLVKAYADMMVKFVRSESQPAVLSGASTDIKSALYLDADTNLVVYHAVANSSGGTIIVRTNTIISLRMSTDEWYRVTIVYDATEVNGDGNCEMFQVKTNGVTVTSSAAYDDNWIDQFNNYQTLPALSPTGTWFRSAQASNDDNAKKFTAVAFQGKGFIDDLVVGTTAPNYTPIAFWTITQLLDLVNGTATHTDASIEVVPGSSFTNTYSSTAYGYIIETLKTNGAVVTAANDLSSYQLILDNIEGNITITNHFYRPSRTITLNFTNGTITTAGGGVTSVLNGASVTNDFTGTAWYLPNLIVAGSYTTAVNSHQVTVTTVSGPITANSSQTVSFGLKTNEVLQIVGANGNVNDVHVGPVTNTFLVTDGSSIVLTNNADLWYQIAALTTNGVAVAGSAGQTNFILVLNEVLANFSNNVSFVRPEWTITANVGLNGSSDATATQILNGNTTTITFNATGWYLIDAITNNGVSIGGVHDTDSYPWVSGPVTNSHTLDASFYLKQYTVTASAVANSTRSPASQSAYRGASADVVYTADWWHRITAVLPVGTTGIGLNSRIATARVEVVTCDTNLSATVGQKPAQYYGGTLVPTSWFLGWPQSSSTENLYSSPGFTTEEEYLLNVNPFIAETNVFAITSIAVDSVNVYIDVGLKINSVNHTNIIGTLKLLGTPGLPPGTWSAESSAGPGDVFTNGSYLFTVPTNASTIFKAIIE